MSPPSRRPAAWLAAGAITLAAGVAQACPNCLGDPRYASVLRAVGVFMLLPFVLLALVAWAIRRAQAEGFRDHGDDSMKPKAQAGARVPPDGDPTAPG